LQKYTPNAEPLPISATEIGRSTAGSPEGRTSVDLAGAVDGQESPKLEILATTSGGCSPSPTEGVALAVAD